MIQRYPFSRIWEGVIVVILHISGARSIFLLCCDSKTPNMSKEKLIIAYLGKYPYRKKHQRLYGKILSIIYNMEEKYAAILHIYGARAISLLFCVHQDTESE